ncbi:MAG: DUF192 domain-containing protein [Sandaracinaceae bacterium]|nr:DUF192 domain-containing protein [Sandaracinaceae bacterium]
MGERAFCARVAATEAERLRGLRGEGPLAPGEGLLLPFPVEDEICIVNDGVSFALDVAYADAAGQVVAIERRLPANDGTPRCHAPVRDVLEVAAGELDGVSVGDTLSR